MSKSKDIIQKQKQYLWPNHLLYYESPLPLERGDGLWVWDSDGNRYLDFFGGILTTSVGHNRKEVVEAAQEQIGKMIHSSTLYPNEAHVVLAEKLAEIAPGDIQVSYFTPSGTDADETAVFLAKAYTGYQEIIALRHGYSGRSAMGMALTGQSAWRIGGTHIIGIKHAVNPYCYRCPLKMTYPECDVACAQDVEDVIKTTTSGKIAAFLAEPIQGVGGFITPPPEYFKIVIEIVRQYGGLFISDEVQTGFGRTGEHWFGIEHWDVQPDILTMAKGIANGFPLANTMTTPEIANSMTEVGLTISTFGGNPVSCAAANATIDVMVREANPAYVDEVGGILHDGLKALQDKYPIMGDVRGKGLMQGIEMVTDRKTKEPATKEIAQLFEETKKLGLLIGKGGMLGNVVRITPSLTVTKNEIEKALEILDLAFARVQDSI